MVALASGSVWRCLRVSGRAWTAGWPAGPRVYRLQAWTTDSLGAVASCLDCPACRHCRYGRPGRCFDLPQAGLWAGSAGSQAGAWPPGLAWFQLWVWLPGRAVLLQPLLQVGWQVGQGGKPVGSRFQAGYRGSDDWRARLKAAQDVRRASLPAALRAAGPGSVLITLLWILLMLTLL